MDHWNSSNTLRQMCSVDQVCDISDLGNQINHLSLQDQNKTSPTAKNEGFTQNNGNKTRAFDKIAKISEPLGNSKTEEQNKENLEQMHEDKDEVNSLLTPHPNYSFEDGEEKEVRFDGTDVLTEMKNENCHLQLELADKEHEIESLKKALTDLQHQPSFNPNIVYQLPCENDKAFFINDSPTRLSLNSNPDYEVMTHFSGSPYRGFRTSSHRVPASLCSTSISRARNDHKFLSNIVLPYIQGTIDIFQNSVLFDEDIRNVGNKFHELKISERSNEYKVQLMAEILDELTYLHRQSVAVLNRELQVKKLFQKFDYLFTIFLTPEEIGTDPPEPVSRLKEELIELIIDIFEYDIDAANKPSERDDTAENYLSKMKKRGHLDPVQKLKKVKMFNQGFDICTEALGKHTKKKIKHKVKSSKDSVKPFSKSTTDLTHQNPNFLATPGVDEKQRLRQHKDNLEFIPIGYYESMLSRKTPQKNVEVNEKDVLKMTPLPNAPGEENEEDENDPLQIFFSEFLESATDQDDTRTTVTSISNF